ncbi:MAG: plasmid mobilization relaxosome protein MobC [Bacteroidota bacterium]|nr:plasmid mobilization relaxosome protein MobC [Bacteroidota bacterium]
MTKDPKKGGRPPLKEGRRTFKIDVRFNETEHQSVLELQKALGLSKTRLIRMRLLENNAAVILNARQVMEALDKVGAELGRSGNNINQLSKHANHLRKKNLVTPHILEHFNKLFEEHLAIRRELDTTMRSMMRQLRK